MGKNEWSDEDERMREELLEASRNIHEKILRQRRRRRRTLILKAVCIILLGITGIALLEILVPAVAGKQKLTNIDAAVEQEAAVHEIGWEEVEKSGSPPVRGEDGNLLVLVNKDHALPEDYQVELHWLSSGRTAVSDQMYGALRDMLTEGTENGLEFIVASGYRSSKYQEQLLEEDIEASMNKGLTYEQAYEKETRETMPPGYSEHETGLAVDIVSTGNQILNEEQENTAENQWLRENCSRFGFILRYPKGSEEITGISYEPWHFRYVGTEAAADIMARGITLEEYLGIVPQEIE